MVHVGATPSTTVSVSASTLTLNLTQYPTGLIVPVFADYDPLNGTGGPASVGIVDGQTFTITRGATTAVFEFDNNGAVTGANRAGTFTNTDTLDNVSDSIALTISLTTRLNLVATNFGGGVIRFVGSTSAHTD